MDQYKKRRENNAARVADVFRAKEWVPKEDFHQNVKLGRIVKPGHDGTLYNQEKDM
jgi:hypothetical protein